MIAGCGSLGRITRLWPTRLTAVAGTSHACIGHLTLPGSSLSCRRQRRHPPKRSVTVRATAGAAGGAGASRSPKGLQALSERAANLFPLWLVLGSGLALLRPSTFLWFRSEHVTPALALTMLSMGTTLTVDDITGVFRQGWILLVGAALQYSVMPLMGFLVSRLAGLPTAMQIGVCLVASCPGGVASNVISYLAGADVPLSVLMTTASTLTAVVATPALVLLLINSLVPVNAAALIASTFQVVLLPVAAGALLNQRFPAQMRRASPFAPVLAVSMTVLICSSVMAQNAAAVRLASGRILAAVAALHGGGFALGYAASRALGAGERQARTISIEVGMQNSTLGAVLAMHFADPLVAVPCAISACMHSLMGSVLAAWFRRTDRPAAA